jgi:hypothetical protein
MQAEYLELHSYTDHNASPEVRRSLLEQDFDSAKHTKDMQVHPSDLKKMTSVVYNLDVA